MNSPFRPNLELPPVFRVLIVDDKIGQNLEFQEQIRNTIDYWARKASDWNGDLIVEVRFESSSVEGFNRWCNEVFDIALIDSDFSENNRTPEIEGSFDLSKSLTSTSHQGFEVLRLVLDKTDPSSGKYEKVFEYRQGANEIYLWSALPYDTKRKDDQEAHPYEIGTLFRRYGLGHPQEFRHFIPKLHEGEMASVPRTVESVVTDGVWRLLGQPRPLTPAQQLERVLYFMSRGDLASHVTSFLGKVVFSDRDNAYKQYPRLGADGSDPVLRVAKCLPDSVDKETAWLPLHGGLAGRHGIGAAVRYMRAPESNPAMKAEYLRLRADCEQEQQLKRPRYPNPPKAPIVKETTMVLGREFKNPFFAAATPLTGTTVVGEEDALAAMVEKVVALLRGPFGAVILKTAYLDFQGQWDDVHWPAIQMQSHMRTRCLFPPSGTSTIWNTGRTAMEMFPPRQLNRFLRKLLSREYVGTDSHRVIVSLGSKFVLPRDWARTNPVVACSTLKDVWSRLFCDVFGSGENRIVEDAFPMVEVNARHSLREMVERQGRGDEYLSPLKLDGDAFDLQDPILSDFLQWLQVIHEVAVENKKELIIKLPHRSDVFAFIKCAMWVRRVHLDSAPAENKTFGVRALTLINTIKTPVWPAISPYLYHQSWYSSPTSWGDAADKVTKYQMSGTLLSAHRGQVLAPLLERRDQLGDLEILIGGGITDHVVLDRAMQDINPFLASEVTAVRSGGVQIGTWALLDMRLDKGSWKQLANPDRAGETEDPETFQIVGCQGCQKCKLEEASDHANYIVRHVGEDGKRYVRLHAKPSLTVDQIRRRIQECQIRAVQLQHKPREVSAGKTSRTDEIRPRFAWLDRTRCRACGRCSRTFYCDAFLDRRQQGLLPVFEPRHCTGCGLCAQICPHSALHVYEPKEYLVVVSHSRESTSCLTAMGIPHMYFNSTGDLARIPMSDETRKIVIAAATGKQETHAVTARTEPTMESLVTERMRNAHALGRGAGRQYADEREYRLKRVDPQFTKGEPGGERARALIWSLLLWSDPGQVLWESPVVTVRASGREADVTHQGKVVDTVAADSENGLWGKLLELPCLKPVLEALDERRSSSKGKI